jgi:hypothetical protein
MKKVENKKSSKRYCTKVVRIVYAKIVDIRVLGLGYTFTYSVHIRVQQARYIFENLFELHNNKNHPTGT